jgi:hypothetical protein
LFERRRLPVLVMGFHHAAVREEFVARIDRLERRALSRFPNG